MLGRIRDVARLVALAAVGTAAIASCGNGSDSIDAFAAGSWPVVHGDARNSNSSEHTDLADASLDWSRPLGGPVVSPVSIASSGQMFVSTYTDTGCNLFSFEIDSGRKRWCNRMGPSAATTTPLVDSVANVYVGDDGGLSSFNEHGQLRWRTPTNGVPKSAQFLGDGSVLAITQLGQISILETQTGMTTVPIHDLLELPDFLGSPGTEFPPPDTGLADCATGSAECPVAATPAVDLDASDIYLVLWREGAIAPQLVSLHYDPAATPAVTERWSSELLPAAVSSSPVLSDDGNTVYLADVDGRLNAYDAEDGSNTWTYWAGFGASSTPSVSSDGTIVPVGGDLPLQAVRDDGDTATQVWSRDDLQLAGTPIQSADNTIAAVVRSGEELVLTSIDAETGDTISDRPLPGATGFTVGTSVGPDGQIVTPTYLGEIFTYTT